MPHLQEITIKKFLKMDFKLDVLDNRTEFIDKQLPMYCFNLFYYQNKALSITISFKLLYFYS